MKFFKKKETRQEKMVRMIRESGVAILGATGIAAGLGIKVAKDKGLGKKIMSKVKENEIGTKMIGKALETGKNLFKKKEIIED